MKYDGLRKGRKIRVIDEEGTPLVLGRLLMNMKNRPASLIDTSTITLLRVAFVQHFYCLFFFPFL